MVTFKKGEAFPLAPQPQEGVIFSVEPYTMLLIYYFRAPQEEEIHAFKNDPVQFAVSELRNTLFILSKFGKLSWMDTPYSTHLSETEKKLPDLAEGQGYSIDAFLVDQETNLLTEHRLLRLDTASSLKLKKLIETDQAKENVTRESYIAAVSEVYRNYSTRKLLELSVFQTKLKG